jgi:hypothetical protein
MVMRWKKKAALQNVIARLPSSVSYALYYFMQRRFGGLKQIDPVERLIAGIETWKKIQAQGRDPRDRVFLEVGTGPVPTVPLAYWLMGAKRTITVDLNPYVKENLVEESLHRIATNSASIKNLFGGLVQPDRFEALLQLYNSGAYTLNRFFDLCHIDYVSRGDAAATGLQPESIDFHTSYTVFEHIPPDVIMQILLEGNRIVRADGLFVHLIDYSDHFAHTDKTISSINFLQYSDAEWDRLAGNRYMYQNRLRHDDFLALFEAAGHKMVAIEPSINAQLANLVALNQLRLNERFATKSSEILSIWAAWIVSQPTASARAGRARGDAAALP